MKKLLGIVVLGLLWCNVVQANTIILSKCYVAKYKNSPEFEEKEFNYKMAEERSYEIDLNNKIVNSVFIKSEEKFKMDINRAKEKKGWIGLMLQYVTKEISDIKKLDKPRGALVAGTFEGGPSDKAGILEEDIILEFDGKAINQYADLPKITGQTEVGKNVEVKIWRNKKEIIKKIKVGDYQKSNPEKRYSITNANIVKVEKDIIVAIVKSKSPNNKFKLMEWILDTKNKTVITKAFRPDEQNVSFSTVEKKCE